MDTKRERHISVADRELNARDEFLLKMYDQMWSNINRHILVIWQSIGALIGAIAIYALVEKDILSIDIASTFIILLVTWMLAHIYDANHWYSRNLAIIANIERFFLKKTDLCHIHEFFGERRGRWSLLEHLKVQYWLGILLAVIFLLHHFFKQVYPGLGASFKNFELVRGIPYITAIGCAIILWVFGKEQKAKFRTFIERSPGIEIDFEDIDCGVHVSHPWFK